MHTDIHDGLSRSPTLSVYHEKWVVTSVYQGINRITSLAFSQAVKLELRKIK